MAVIAVVAFGPSAQAQPQLLLLHPGAFVIGSPAFEFTAARYARRDGFKATNLHYPRADLTGQMRYTAQAAKTAAKDGPVYAYGDSAGATLAARLAQRGLVRKAAAYSPVVNLLSFAATAPGGPIARLNAVSTKRERRRLDLSLHSTKHRILVLGGAEDHICLNAVASAWARSDPMVEFQAVPGGHLGDGPNSPEYRAAMHTGIDWLR